MSRPLRESPIVDAAIDTLHQQGYKPDQTGYAMFRYTLGAMFHPPGGEDPAKIRAPEFLSVAGFRKDTGDGNLHLVSIFVNEAKPSQPLITGFTAPPLDVAKGIIRFTPLPAVPVAEFLTKIGTEPVADYLAGLMRKDPGSANAVKTYDS